ncbi:MAG: PQQ-binding-like beta-propeller repeat protein [Pseudomonadota bacterium]|nr:PQQ-binding-like beta-propeller repeat protein [Pseudomonadota bacterium]
MRVPFLALVLALAGAGVATAALAGASAPPAEQRHGDRNWPDMHGGSKGWHYSALDEIDARNVARLQQVWTHSPDLATEGLESAPVAADGLIAYCSGSDQVWVLDGATGRLRWRARVGTGHADAGDAACRGLAFDGGTLYFAGAGGRVAAWNAASGEPRWETQVLPRDSRRGVLSGPPVIIGDRMVVGSLVGNPGERGVLLGIDTHSGREAWRIELAGGPGPAGGHWDGSASWGSGADRASGASAWLPGPYDAGSHTLYWGVGSPLPLFDAAGAYYQTRGPRPGDNLYTAGVLAFDPQTGILHAWHQEIPHEVWVQDSAVSEMLLLDRDGRRILVHPNRTGLVFVYSQDLQVQRVWQAIRNFNLARAVDPQNGAFVRRHDLNAGDRLGVCPLYHGGFPGLPGAYSPQTGLWYKIAAEWCMDIDLDRPLERAAGPAALALGGRVTPVPPPDGRMRAHLDARDPVSGAKAWTVEFPEPPLASLLVTAGRLLFVADGRGAVQALDAGSGRRLWRADDHEGHAGGLLTYEAAGHQYIALVTGWDSHAHPLFGRMFGAPYNGARTPRASLRVYRLP